MENKKSTDKPKIKKIKTTPPISENGTSLENIKTNSDEVVLIRKEPSEAEVIEPQNLDEYYNFVDFDIDGHLYKTTLNNKFLNKKAHSLPNPKHIKAFIPGTIQKVFVKEKTKVKAHEKLLILEAMKMKNVLFAPVAGVVKKIYVKQGDRVTNKQLLVEIL
ncbi:MAG: acetyl-CoA carboxylase biotin carboxyl carrier protein subunit [Bacteroidales bacterium]|nr:acetyl-CoA carboxylase biotin carboxyl carrier protein subunit [Bacteroidales bacterium]